MDILVSGLLLGGTYALMAMGLQLPVAFPATLWVVEGERLSGPPRTTNGEET